MTQLAGFVPQRVALRLGFWSALVIVLLFLLFTLCFIAIATMFPLYIWDGLSGYLEYLQNYPHPFADMARLSMLIFCPALIVLFNSVYEIVPEHQRYLARMSTHFSMIAALLIAIHYFVQLTAVRFSIEAGEITGLSQFIQSNPDSVILAINMLGVTFAFGLASLLIAPVFSGTRLQNIIRWAWIINGIMCLTGGIAYMLQLDVLIFLTLNPGMGGAVLIACTGTAMLFRQKLRESRIHL